MENANDRTLLDQIYALKKMRDYYEPMFYLSRKAYEGKHFTYYNRETQRLTEIPVKKNIFNQLPEIAKQADSFENFLLSTDFTFTVVPKQLSDETAIQESQALSLLASDYYQRIKSNSIFADYLHYAILDNTSFLEVTPNDQKTDVDIRSFDGFDILFNPLIKDWNKQTLVVKVVKRRLSELKKSLLYTVPSNYVGGGSGMFSWKDVYEKEKYSSFAKLGDDEVFIFECYLLDPVNGLTIKTIDWSGNVIRNDKYPNIKRIPIIPFRIFSGEWLQPSYVYRLIPINRSMDLMMSRMEDLMLRLSKGGWLLQEEEGLNGGMDEDLGQILRYSATKPEQMEMPQIPSFFMQLFTTMTGLSERYGFSSIFSGDMSSAGSGLRTTGMLEQLTGLTTRNNSSPINNLRMATKSILELVFMFLYEMWDTPHEVLYTDAMQTSPRFVSQKYKALYREGAAVGIPGEFKRFEVEIDDGMGYTLQQKKDTAIALRKLGILGDDAVKKVFKLGASGYLMEAEDKGMAESPEFKALIQAFPQMSPEQKQALITVLKTVSMMKKGGQQPPVAPAGGAPTDPNAPPAPGPEGTGGTPAANPLEQMMGGEPNAS